MEIKFVHSMGFVGSSYSMTINGKYYSFGFVRLEEAIKMSISKLKELNIEYDEDDINFIWDGTL